MNRLFSNEQKREHDLLFSHQCQWEIGHSKRCPHTVIEADHIPSFSESGTSKDDQMVNACLAHHALRHKIDNEVKAVEFILGRMNYEELIFFAELCRGLGL